MATLYWFGGNGTWNTFSVTNWSTAAPTTFNGTMTGTTTLTVSSVAGTALAIGKNIVRQSDGVFLGTITGGSGTTWTVDFTGTYTNEPMGAGTIAAAAPTSTDDVIFDPNAGSVNFSVFAADGICQDFTVTMATAGRLTFAGYGVSCYRNTAINAATTIDTTFNFYLLLYALSGAISVGLNNVKFFEVRVGYSSTSTATFTLGSGLTACFLYLYSGTLNTNGQTVTLTTSGVNSSQCLLQVIDGGTSALTLGASAINIGTSASEVVNSSAIFRINSTTHTFTAGTSVITIGSTNTTNWNSSVLECGQSYTFATVVLNGHYSAIFGANTFATRLTRNAVFNNSNLVLYATQTLPNSGHTLQLLGTASTRLLVLSPIAGTPAVITGNATGTRTLSYVSFMDIQLSFGSNVSGTSVGDMLGNVGINFDAPRTLYLVLGSLTKNFSDSSGTSPWSLNPSGIPTGASQPLPQDTVIFNANSGSGTVVLDTVHLGIINTTGFVGSATYQSSNQNNYEPMYVMQQPTDPAGVLNSYGSAVVYAFSGSNINLPALPGVSVYINGRGVTANLTSNLTNNSITVQNGGFDTNSFNVTSAVLTTFTAAFNNYQGSSIGTKTITLGSSYITLTSSNPLNLDSTTFNAGTSTIEVINSSGATCTFSNIATKTFNNLKLTKTSTATVFTYVGLGSATFSNITVSPHTSLIRINLAAGGTTTVNSLTTGATKGNGIIIGVDLTSIGSVTTNATLAIGSNIVTEYVAFLGITKSGASALSARGAADLGANQNINFDPHSVIAFSGSGATSFTVPDNFTGSSYLLVLGAGGGAARRSSATVPSGGGGGGAIALASNLNVSRGQTIYLNAPTGGAGATVSGAAGGSPANAWVNIAANSQPTLNTNGAYAESGNGSTAGGGATAGLASLSLGQLVFSGGNGGTGFVSGGGGGSGASLIFRLGRSGGSSSFSGGLGGFSGASIQNAGSTTGTSTGATGGAVSPNAGGAGGVGGASPQPGGSGVAGSSVGGGGGGGTSTSGVNAAAGGDGAAGSQWTYRSLNGVLSSGTIGYGGGAGGGGGSNATTNGAGGRGGNGGNGAGGGGGGRGSTSGGATGNGGNGGDALVLFVYVESRGFTYGAIIG